MSSISLKIRLGLWFGLFLFSMGGQAHASSKGAVHSEFMNPLDQVTLTSKAVEKTIAVLPKLIALTQNYKGKHSTGPSLGAGNSKDKIKNAKYEAFTSALQALSSKHGFKDAKIMQSTVETTMLTAGFINSGKSLAQVERQIAKTQSKVEANPKLTEKQKSSLLRRMHIQVSMVVPTAENIKIVQPYFLRILKISDKKK